MPQVFDTPVAANEPPSGYRRFVLPRFVSEVDIDKVAQATTTLRYLLAEKHKIKESVPDEKQWTTVWRVKFHDLLEQMDRPDAYTSLDWLLRTMEDMTNPGMIPDLAFKIMEWPNLGEELIGAKAVGNLLLSALKREKKALERRREEFNAVTQQESAKNTFELLTAIAIEALPDKKGNPKEKTVAPSSIQMSEGNVQAGRTRLHGETLRQFDAEEDEVAERLDYVTQAVAVITETYDLLVHVSIQNQGLRKNGHQQGA